MKRKVTNKKNIKVYIKFVILLICFIIVIQIFLLTMSRYESNSNSKANVDIAFYVLNEDYQSMTLNLGKIVPSANLYTYNFSVSNEKDGKIAEVDIEYELKIRATTNLPLDIHLYKNENGNRKEGTSSVEQDEDGMYFNILKVDKGIFYYSTPRTDNYTLEILFPEKYNEETYQDITDLIEISVNAKQIIDET